MKQLRVALALIALGLVGSGCGKVADKATEKLTEKACEDGQRGENCDVDISEVGTSVNTDDGESSAGATTDYPDGYPDYLKIDGVAPEFASKDSIGGSATFSVAVVEDDATVEDLVGTLRSQLEDAGCTSTIDDTSPGSAVVEYACDAGTAGIIAGDTGGSASLTISFIER